MFSILALVHFCFGPVGSSMMLSFSLRNFVADADNYAIKMVDNLLDVLTHNEHSKTLKHFQSVSVSSVVMLPRRTMCVYV